MAPAVGPLLELLPIALLAGLFGLDVVSFPQAMISRPLVAATVGGAFMGAPIAGLACGVALECLALESLPVGASRYNEWGSAAIVAGAVAARGAGTTTLPLAGTFAMSVAIGIMVSWLGGWTMVRHRQMIATFARPRLGQLAEGNRHTVVGLQVFGMTADFVRGALVAAVVYLPARGLVDYGQAHWREDDAMTRAVVVTGVAAVAATAVWKDFHAISLTRRLFLGSLAIGTMLVVLRG